MVKRENGYPEEQYVLIIMDTFKGQDNDRLRKLCSENYCDTFIVAHNLTNKSRTCVTSGVQMQSQHS